jgi:hypothetical protein
MGRLVADAGKRDWEELTAAYGAMLMEGLAVRSPELGEGMGTRGKHVNAEGPALDGLSQERAVGRGQAGVVGPNRGLPARAGAADRAPDVASHRLKHHLDYFPVPEWVAGTRQQVYLNPYPKELMLRNHV